jgi:hypothetical protein
MSGALAFLVSLADYSRNGSRHRGYRRAGQDPLQGAGQSTPSRACLRDKYSSQVNGYAKKFAGTIFNKPEEKEFGEKKLRGEA